MDPISENDGTGLFVEWKVRVVKFACYCQAGRHPEEDEALAEDHWLDSPPIQWKF